MTRKSGFSAGTSETPLLSSVLDRTSPFRNGQASRPARGSKAARPSEEFPGVLEFTDARGDTLYCTVKDEVWISRKTARRISEAYVAAQEDDIA